MIKQFIMTMLALFSMVIASAQDVHYYKLTRKEENGKSSTNVSGGQFITFLSDICYESNKKGVGVGHGKMTRNSTYSNSQYSVYQGSSYWGNDATFKFNSDKSVLNVVLDNGDIYVYKRTTPPVGVTTCSLIRKPSSSSGGGGNFYEGGYQYPTQQPSYQQPEQNQSSGGNPRQLVKEQVRCSRCNGTGRMVYNTYPGTLGQPDYKVRCNECGEEHLKSTGHTHVTCNECKGSGTITRTRVQ